jgi:hypothetical protein
VNYHEGQKVAFDENCISVWGPHPVKAGDESFPIGAGLTYSDKVFPSVEKIENMVRIVSKPVSKVRTEIVSCSVKEAELNSAKRFESYMQR